MAIGIGVCLAIKTGAVLKKQIKVLVKDGFEGAAGALGNAETGQAWAGNMKKSGGTAYADVWTTAKIDAGTSNFVLTCDITRGVNTTCSVGFRVNGDNDANRMEFLFNPTTIEINKRVNWTTTSLGSVSRAWTANQLVKVKIIAKGTNVKYYCNDELLFNVNVTDADLLSKTFVAMFSNNNPAVRYDNFLVTEVE